MHNRQFGSYAEGLVIKFLQEQGYKILQKNYRCKFGEIDIIAKHQEFLVFIEVKARTSCKFGLPQDSINYHKQQKIRNVSQVYLSVHNLHQKPIRYDVVALLFNKQYELEKIEVIKNAF